MKAITVKYTGPTNCRAARWIATDNDGNVKVRPDHQMGAHEDADATAVELCQKMNWKGLLVRGRLGNDYVYVWLSDTAASQIDRSKLHEDANIVRVGMSVETRPPEFECPICHNDFRGCTHSIAEADEAVFASKLDADRAVGETDARTEV